MNEEDRKSILQMAKGAIQERVDYEVGKVVDNILDVNTEPKAKRKIVLTIEMVPNEERQIISTNVTAKSTLAPTKSISTALAITADKNGEMIIAEVSAQVPGQMDIEGNVQPQPKILKFATM